jgi:sugar lactone lactonase YvrE
VGLSADAVVANRAGGSIVKIAADEADCIDRNGNGKIDTWKGPGDVPPEFMWPAGQGDSPDECVLWWTDLLEYNAGQSPYPRAAGFDALVGDKGELSVFVYIGLYMTGQLLRVDGTTGKVIKVIKVPGSPYGLVIDKDGSVWVQSVSSLVKVDVQNNDEVTEHPATCMYGITTDSQGRIYTSGGGCLRRYDPATGANDTLQLPGSGSGVAVDKDGHAWTGDSKLMEIDASGQSGEPMVLLGQAENGGHGAAIDYDNRPWCIPLNGTDHKAFKVDASKKNAQGEYMTEFATVGYGNYTYSDMTGFQLTNSGSSKVGVVRHTFTSCGPEATFDAILIDAEAPPMTLVTVSIRTADAVVQLKNDWQKVASIPPDGSPIALNIPPAAVMQVEVAMKSDDPMVTPILSSVSVTQSGCPKPCPPDCGSDCPPGCGKIN